MFFAHTHGFFFCGMNNGIIHPLKNGWAGAPRCLQVQDIAFLKHPKKKKKKKKKT